MHACMAYTAFDQGMRLLPLFPDAAISSLIFFSFSFSSVKS